MELPTKQSGLPIEAGQHEGVVSDVYLDTDDYEYVQIELLVTDHDEDDDVTVEVGYPATISSRSALGKLIMRMSEEPVWGEDDIDLEDILLDRNVEFNLYEGENGFLEVNKASVNPVEG